MINVEITTATKINALKRASSLLFCSVDMFQTYSAVLTCQQGFARLKLVDFLHRHIEHRLNDRTLRGKHEDFIVQIPESGADAPWITKGKRLTAASYSAHHVATIPIATARAKHVGDVYPLLYGVGKVKSGLAFRATYIIYTLHFTVQSVTYLLQKDMSVSVFTWMLTISHYALEYLIDVSQIEIATESKVFRSPVVATKERVNVVKSALSRSGIT